MPTSPTWEDVIDAPTWDDVADAEPDDQSAVDIYEAEGLTAPQSAVRVSSGGPATIPEAMEESGFDTAIKSGQEATGNAFQSLQNLTQSVPRSPEELGAQRFYGAKTLQAQFPGYQPEGEAKPYEGIDLPSLAPSMNTWRHVTLDPFSQNYEDTEKYISQLPPSMPEKIAVGGVEGLDELARGITKFFTSPSGAVQLGLSRTPVAPAVYTKWAIDMARGGYTSSQDAIEDFKKSDWRKLSKDVVLSFGMFLGSRAALKHGAKIVEQRAVDYAVPSGVGVANPKLKIAGAPPQEKKKGEELTEAEYEETYQLEQMQKEGKLSESDATRLEELNQRYDQERMAELEPAEAVELAPERKAMVDEVAGELGVETKGIGGAGPDTPFSGMMSTINRDTGEILLNHEALNYALSRMPDAAKRRDYVQSLLSEEQTHLATPDSVAEKFAREATGLEKFIARRRYTKTFSGKLEGRELSEKNIGHEMLRMHMQKLRGMTPTEIAHSVATGKGALTAKTLVALERSIFEIRKAIGTKASKRQLDYLDEVAGNIRDGLKILSGGVQGAAPQSPNYQQPRALREEELKKLDAEGKLDEAGKAELDQIKAQDQGKVQKEAWMKAMREEMERNKPQSPAYDRMKQIEDQPPEKWIEFARSMGGRNQTKWSYDFAEQNPDLSAKEMTDAATRAIEQSKKLGYPDQGMKKQFWSEAAKWRQAMDEAGKLENPTKEQLGKIEQDIGVGGLDRGRDLMDALKRQESSPASPSYIPNKEWDKLSDIINKKFHTFAGIRASRESLKFWMGELEGEHPPEDRKLHAIVKKSIEDSARKDPEIYAAYQNITKKLAAEGEQQSFPASPSYGPSKRGQRAAEELRKIQELRLRAKGEEVPEELKVTPRELREDQPQFGPVPGEERVGAVESGARGHITAAELQAKAKEFMSSAIKIKDKDYTEKQVRDLRVDWQRPKFEDFAKWASRNMEGAKPEQLREMWENEVWSHLLNASSERLVELQKALGMRQFGKSPQQIKLGDTGGVRPVAEETTAQAAKEERQFSERETLIKKADSLEKKATKLRHQAEAIADKPDVIEEGLFGQVSTRDEQVKDMRSQAARLDETAGKMRSLIGQSKAGKAPQRTTGASGEQARLPLKFKSYAPESYKQMLANQPALEKAPAPAEMAVEPVSGAGPERMSNRHRTRLITMMADRLTREAVGGTHDLERTAITMEDLDFSNAKSKAGTYYEISKEDLRKPGRLVDVLRDQARASNKDPESHSRRLIAVVGSDGRVHLLSTYNDAGVQRVTDVAGAKAGRRLDAGFLAKYRPFATLLLENPVKNLRQEFASMSEFNDKIGNEARERSKISESGFAAEGPAPEDFEAEGTPGIEGEGGMFMGPKKGLIPAEGRRPALKAKVPLTINEAEAMVTHLIEEVSKVESPEDVRLAIDALSTRAAQKKLNASETSAINAYRKIFSGMEKSNPDASFKVITDQMAQKIYDLVSSDKSLDEVAGSLVAEYGGRKTLKEVVRKSELPRELTKPNIRPPTSQEAFAGPFQRAEAPSAELGLKQPKPYIPEGVRVEETAEQRARRLGKARAVTLRAYQKKGVVMPFEEAGKVAGMAPEDIQKAKELGYKPSTETSAQRLARSKRMQARMAEESGVKVSLKNAAARSDLMEGPMSPRYFTGTAHQGEVRAKELVFRSDFLKSHTELGFRGAARWRYDESENRVRWTDTPPTSESMDAVDNFLAKRGITPERHVSATSGLVIYRDGVNDTNPLSPAYRLPKVSRDIVSKSLKSFGSFYDEWMVDRMVRHGGAVAEQAGVVFRHIIDREKELYGKLTGNLDRARTLAGGTVAVETTKLGKVLGKTVSGLAGQVPSPKQLQAVNWANEVIPVKGAPFAGTSRVVDVFESNNPVPAYANELISAARLSNLGTGKLIETVSKKFKATGKFERHINALGYDIIREGRGDLWRQWTAALAQANNAKLSFVRSWFRKFKEELDKPGVDVAKLERINQDFKRQMPNVVTHLKRNGIWEPVIHADLFNYLENSARKATHMVAFREQFPNTQKGRAKLSDARESVATEMGAKGQAAFDAMVRTMQGIPTDNYSTGFPGRTLRTVNATVGNLMAKMALTGQLFVQPGESIAGSTSVFLSHKNYLKGMARVKQIYADMEQRGEVNRVIYDFSFNKNSKIRSLFRIASNTTSKTFIEQALNELQEAGSAATANVVAENITSGRLSKWEKRMLPETFKAMGFNHDEVAGLMQGDAALLAQFKRKAPPFLTAGNKAISEGSALGANRLFNSVFRFQTYPMMKANQFRKVAVRMAEAWESGTTTEKKRATEMFTRFIVGNTLQGALTVGITSAIFGGTMGLAIKANQAKDEPVDFLAEAFMATVSGPAYSAWQGMKYKGIPGFTDAAARMVFPYSAVTELSDMASGKGRYRDQDTFSRIGTFISARTPGTRGISQGLALVGLSEKDKKLDAALDGFYRWRRDTMGFDERRSFLKKDDLKEFRVQMRRAVDALKAGNADKFQEAYMSAAEAKGDLGRKGGVDFTARKVLRNATGGPLTEDEKDALRARIGDDAVDRLEYFDLMLEAAGSGEMVPKYDE